MADAPERGGVGRRAWRAGLILLPITFGLALTGTLVVVQRDISTYIHPARVVVQDFPAAHGLVSQDVTLTTQDGLHLAAWFIPSVGGRALILVHGIGASRGALLDLAAALHGRGYAVLLFDLRAQGQSEGTTSTLGAKEALDVAAALAFLQQQPGVDPDQIAVYGQSLGGVAALLAAAQYPALQGVVADSAFASARWLVDNQLQRVVNLPSWLGPILLNLGAWEAGISPEAVAPVDTIDRISPRPVLLIQGDADTLIEPMNAVLLYQAAREPKILWEIQQAPHVGGYSLMPDAYVDHLDAFFQQAFSHTAT